MRLGAYAHNKEFPDARQMILDALGIDGDTIERERAVYIGDDGPIIHTRTGGGNRPYYPNKALKQNKFYINDVDDDFDSTYADFFYSWPDGLKEKLIEAGYLEK